MTATWFVIYCVGVLVAALVFAWLFDSHWWYEYAFTSLLAFLWPGAAMILAAACVLALPVLGLSLIARAVRRRVSL